uniref:Cystatin F n=2 Tax=Podarcis muralis TaxID=64176 RepID=A0A670KD55_PODMU
MRVPEQTVETPLPLLGAKKQVFESSSPRLFAGYSRKVEMVSVGWRKMSLLCCLLLCNVARTSAGSKRHFPNSAIKPGSPIAVKTNDPGVQRAARFGVYRYNNSSNDIFLFREFRINKAMRQVVRGVKYKIDVDICRTVCSKRIHPEPDLDRCDFQRKKTLRQTFRCYFEVWITPWLHQVEVPVSLCQ